MKVLREPLLHFLVIGALLFGVFSWVSSDEKSAPGEIVVTTGQIANLEATFSRTWQRPPTAQELHGLVADYVRDEVLYREAVAMGLDRDDALIRRRLRQKLEFVTDVVAEVEPTDDELKAYASEHPEQFRTEPQFSFSHVYFKPESERPGAAELEGVLRSLNAGTTNAEDTGDAFMPGFQFEDLASSSVAQIFGESFAAWMKGSGSGAWEGPVTSAYGTHLVRVDGRVAAGEPSFEQIREAARREWLHARKVAANDALYEKLRARYVVKVESLPEQGRRQTLAEARP